MKDTLEYRKMCYSAVELQDEWEIDRGDYFVLKASYCLGHYGKCDDKDNLCDGCLELSNQFIIGYNFVDKAYLFNPVPSVLGSGHRMNSTHASILVKDDEYLDFINPKNRHIKETFWMPRLDQLNEMIHLKEDISPLDIQKQFVSFMSHSYYGTLESTWLAFIMDRYHDKRWDGSNWVSTNDINEKAIKDLILKHIEERRETWTRNGDDNERNI